MRATREREISCTLLEFLITIWNQDNHSFLRIERIVNLMKALTLTGILVIYMPASIIVYVTGFIKIINCEPIFLSCNEALF